MRRTVRLLIMTAGIAVLGTACVPPVRPIQLPGGPSSSRPPTPTVDATENADGSWTVVNPATGAELATHVYLPTTGTATEWPALVLVPGGRSDSSLYVGGQLDAQDLADLGWVVVTFDPDGRGDSTGTEDEGGADHQAGLAEIVEFTATMLDEVDVQTIGIVTNSYGVTIATGALTTFDLAVDFLIDWEGPADRNDTGSCAGGRGHLRFYDCTDETFWAEREAINFVDELTIPYLRMQSETDHVQPDTDTAMAMVNAALAGGVRAVYLNDLAVTATLSAIPDGELLADMPWDANQAVKVDEYARLLDAL